MSFSLLQAQTTTRPVHLVRFCLSRERGVYTLRGRPKTAAFLCSGSGRAAETAGGPQPAGPCRERQTAAIEKKLVSAAGFEPATHALKGDSFEALPRGFNHLRSASPPSNGPEPSQSALNLQLNLQRKSNASYLSLPMLF